jgi:hypothetical protein
MSLSYVFLRTDTHTHRHTHRHTHTQTHTQTHTHTYLFVLNLNPQHNAEEGVQKISRKQYKNKKNSINICCRVWCSLNDGSFLTSSTCIASTDHAVTHGCAFFASGHVRRWSFIATGTCTVANLTRPIKTPEYLCVYSSYAGFTPLCYMLLYFLNYPHKQAG